jgi:hypothetical protein
LFELESVFVGGTGVKIVVGVAFKPGRVTAGWGVGLGVFVFCGLIPAPGVGGGLVLTLDGRGEEALVGVVGRGVCDGFAPEGNGVFWVVGVIEIVADPGMGVGLEVGVGVIRVPGSAGWLRMIAAA